MIPNFNPSMLVSKLQHAAHTITVLAVCAGSFFLPFMVQGQQYDLLIKNGFVIDPKNQVNTKKDLAIVNGRIAKVAARIAASESKKTIDATGLFVVPGLIDIHTHVFVGTKPDRFADGINSVSPDDFTFKSGVTTVVDAGTAGWRNFALFREQVINRSQTRVLAFVNIAGSGMIGKPFQEDLLDMNTDSVLAAISRFKDLIVGVKIGHYEGSEWTPFERAMEAARSSNSPLFVECHLPKYSLEEQLEKMRPGDIITHSFEQVAERQAVVDAQGKVQSFVLAAQKKGVLFDVGHGGAGFWFDVAVPAFRQGLAPNSFGTDLHRFSMNAGMKNMLNVMSKYMAIGMSMQDVVTRATWNTARSIKREDLGNLDEGSVADIAILSILKGRFGFVDAGGKRLEGNTKLEVELTLRAGKVVWDLNGIAAQPWK